MGLGEIANAWLGNEPMAYDAVLYRGPDDHWLYDLPAGALYELPNREPAPAPLPVLARSDYNAGVPDAPAVIRITRPTMESYGYDDPLLRIANGQAGTVDPAGPYAGYSGEVPQYDLSGTAAQASLFSQLRALVIPPMTLTGTPAPAARAPASSSRLLMLGAAALVLVLVLRGRK